MRTNKITIVTHLGNEGARIEAYCLATDSWGDYEYFRDAARAFVKLDDIRGSNRYLRAGLLSLFAHFEGVVQNICALCGDLFDPLFFGKRLCDRTRAVAKFAKTKGQLPYLNFRLEKSLRNIIAHPVSDVDFGDKPFSEIDTFSILTCDSLASLGMMISDWLDAVCKILDVQRFTDTEEMVRSIASALGDSKDRREV